MRDYAFGDSGLAARRLSLVAETFAESSRAFLLESVKARPQLAADLGCGPGYTTKLLADTLDPNHTVGLDNSESFLAQARTTATEKVSFRLHDITSVPFPNGPFDLIYGRLVLTHLPEPEKVILTWGTQLRPMGLLLMEEVERIDTDVPALVTYLDIQQGMLAHQNNELYIGPRLEAITGSDKLQRRVSRINALQVPACRAAEMFHMNLGVWRHNDFVRAKYDAATLDCLEQALLALAQDENDSSPVEWQLRQMVMERPAR